MGANLEENIFGGKNLDLEEIGEIKSVNVDAKMTVLMVYLINFSLSTAKKKTRTSKTKPS